MDFNKSFVYNVADYGAKGDGFTKDTLAIQRAIDKCSEAGGTVYFPNGRYLMGTIYMKSGVTLKLEVRATLLGSPELSDYAPDTHYNRYDNEPFMDRCLIYSHDIEDICIEGPGTIDGQGGCFFDENNPYAPHPMLMRFLKCRNIRLAGFKVRMPAGWSTAFLECGNVVADSLDILSRHSNGDGLDFDSCRNVIVSNCRFDTSDDSICLQNSVKDRPSRNITVTNCIMTSKWAAVRIGLLSSGDFEHVTFSNCIFHDIRCSGFKIQSTEGGTIRSMVFQNIVMRNVARPLFLTFNHCHIGAGAPAKPPETGGISSLRFENIKAVYDPGFKPDPAAGIVIMGTPGHYIKNIDLSGIEFIAPGGWEEEMPDAEAIPELMDCRPESFVFKRIPAYGIYARHVKGLRIRDVRLGYDRTDLRPPVFLDDVRDSELSGIWARVDPKTDLLVKRHNSADVDETGCRAVHKE